MKKIPFIVIIGLMIYSCRTKDRIESDKISGAYVREYSFKVVNLESGVEIGMRTIRDTIFVKPFQDSYEISNHKWAMNDYDNEGWRNMAHWDDRPMITYKASFDKANSTLNSEATQSLYLDFEKRLLYKAKQSNEPYRAR